jgi:hypothetical protein
MQFLPWRDLFSARRVRLSTSVLNELYLHVFGRKNAEMERFGVLTQANWQGAPSRDSVQPFCGSRNRVESPLFWLLTWPLAYAMKLASFGRFTLKISFGVTTKLHIEGCV